MANDTPCLSAVDLSTSFLRTDANIPGVVVIILFYGIILAAGFWAPWLARCKLRRNTRPKTTEKKGIPRRGMVQDKLQKTDNDVEYVAGLQSSLECIQDKPINEKKDIVGLGEVESLILAGRNMGVAVGSLTLAATCLGGGMLNGTVQTLMDPNRGLVWCQAPVYYLLSMLITPYIFAGKMRKAGHGTLLDPIQASFGRIQTSVLFIPPLVSDIFWSASILTSLGYALSIIVGMNFVWAVVISEAVSILYTFTGGLNSVAYTDIVELMCIFLPLCVALPFAMNHPAAGPIRIIGDLGSSWVGAAPDKQWIAYYIDEALTLMLGGTCWQCYYQRVLAQKTDKGMYLITWIGFVIVIITMIPVVLSGAVAFSTDWNATEYREIGNFPLTECVYPMALPMVMKYLTPVPVAVIGLGAISAAVMSSTDSAALSTASLTTLHIYSPLRQAITKSEATNRELQWTMRLSVVVVGMMSTTLAICVPDTYGFLVLAGDIQYLLFPHLLVALYVPFCNTYGSMVAFSTSLLLRLLSGEPTIHLPAYIRFPYYDSQLGMQMFPYRTCIVIFSIILIVSVSLLTGVLARHSSVFRKLDQRMLHCFVQGTSEISEEYAMHGDQPDTVQSFHD